jgi:hypothetical protein
MATFLIEMVDFSLVITYDNLGVMMLRYVFIYYSYMLSRKTSIAIRAFYATLLDRSLMEFIIDGIIVEWYSTISGIRC